MIARTSSGQVTPAPVGSAGRVEGLKREVVLDVALAIADAEGIEAVGIRRLAQHFGVTPMALYWHVKNKDELLAAMGDQVLSRLELPSPDSLPWDQHYRLLLTTVLEALRAHPGSVQLAGMRILHSEPGRNITERALALLRGAGLSVQASADIARSSLQTMMMLISVEPGVELGTPREQWPELAADKAATLAALPVDRYPNLVACAAAMVDCDDEAAYYRDGVELFLAGVRAQVAAAKAERD